MNGTTYLKLIKMNTSEVKDLDSLRVWAALKRQERPDLKDEIISFVKWAETEVNSGEDEYQTVIDAVEYIEDEIEAE